MKTISTTAIVALMTATLGLSAVAPAMAQTAAPAPQVEAGQPGERAFRPGGEGPRRIGFGGLLGIERGAEAVEVALVRLSHRIELTEEQQALLDELKTVALAAAEDFAAVVEPLRPAAPAEGETAQRPDFSALLETRIAVESAHLAALEAIQPAATAFFDSLTDEQKAQLVPGRGERPDGPRQGHFGQRPGSRLPGPAGVPDNG